MSILPLLLIAVQIVATPSATAQTLMLQGGPVVIELDPVIAPVASNTASRLRWNRVNGPSKIMVSSVTTEQQFDLYVEAQATRRGVAVGEVQLISGDAAQDFVVGIDRRAAGRCTLGYRAETRAELGYGTQIQTVTYTITSL